MKAERAPRCGRCGGTGKRLHKPLDIIRPNGTRVLSFPYWEECDTCGGTGRVS